MNIYERLLAFFLLGTGGGNIPPSLFRPAGPPPPPPPPPPRLLFLPDRFFHSSGSRAIICSAADCRAICTTVRIERTVDSVRHLLAVSRPLHCPLPHAQLPREHLLVLRPALAQQRPLGHAAIHHRHLVQLHVNVLLQSASCNSK